MREFGKGIRRGGSLDERGDVVASYSLCHRIVSATSSSPPMGVWHCQIFFRDLLSIISVPRQCPLSRSAANIPISIRIRCQQGSQCPFASLGKNIFPANPDFDQSAAA